MTSYHFLYRMMYAKNPRAVNGSSPRSVMYRTRESDKGFTLVELIVAVGLFTLVMTLASGAYLLMIGINRQAQSIAVGINDLSFVIETMTYNIRTGTTYNCGGVGDCPNGLSSFSFINAKGDSVTYSYNSSNSSIEETINSGAPTTLTDPLVKISSLMFYAVGTAKLSAGDTEQSRVTLIISGAVSSGPGKTENFTVESAATMRGSDL